MPWHSHFFSELHITQASDQLGEQMIKLLDCSAIPVDIKHPLFLYLFCKFMENVEFYYHNIRYNYRSHMEL